ncbi:PREDICTED: cell division control protein 45 homolog isoform X2 [Polistes dominula]|uniref:Cell division control protein 45 homolog isoform X2 n=1 Tax=Polistes dominula TaxID=743375 RepID=A0ABM1JGE8_POLDO|nr:PREDICTED: cell division control protein 45 homolog isoform X2 [Polistes dominula]
MFVPNLEKEFYNAIQRERCLLLVNFDVDAICACRILQQLFKNDNILYTLVPVQGIQDMVQAIEENCEEVKNVIMINCGGTIDLVELLQPPESVIFFIIDSHRPYDLCNIYSEYQIRILGKPDTEDEIPEYNDVFRDDSSEDESDSNENSDNSDSESRRPKRRRLNEEDLLKREQKRLWTENRANLLFNYSQYSYYGKSSAVLIFEMAWHMSKDNLDMLWWAIIGSTEQAILSKVESQTSILEEGTLQAHVSRLSHKQGITNDNPCGQSVVRITYDKDLRLVLYRHWTVEASLRHSMPTAVSLRLWSIRGEQRLKELLAEMGLPLAQSRQRFTAMDLTLRHEFRQMVEKLAGKYNVDRIIGTSFTLQYGYRFKYCASDIVYAMLALIESTTKDRLPQRCFLDALDCLSRTKKELLENGIEKAKLMLSNIFKTAQIILEMKQIMNTGSFLYVIVPDGTLDSRLFAHPHPLIMLAQFTLKAYVHSCKSKRAREWPMIASALFNPEEGTCLIVGIPPICEDQPRSLFGKAFEQAAKNTGSYINADYFDTTIVRLKVEERPKFFDALAALLT